MEFKPTQHAIDLAVASLTNEKENNVVMIERRSPDFFIVKVFKTGDKEALFTLGPVRLMPGDMLTLEGVSTSFTIS